MKKVLLILILLNAWLCDAQNYQCLQSGVKHYFTNGNGYLRGIRIDSVRTSGSDIIYYPFHTPRGKWWSALGGYAANLDSNGGSWLGKRVLQKNDGTFLFDNLWGDTVIIKTKASLGSSWIFCRDSSSLYYQALLTSIDTMTVLGSVDSVKNILVTAHNNTGIVPTDPVDSFQIILSKNNGFIQVFDLYTFPYHKPDSVWGIGLDFYLDHATAAVYPFSVGDFSYGSPNASNSIFKMTEFIDPTSNQLSEQNVGDVLETAHYLRSNVLIYRLDTIKTKNILPGGISYSFSGLRGDYDNVTFSYTIAYDTGVNTTDTTLLFDTAIMPEETTRSRFSTCNYYYPGDSNYCSINTA